jgi:hypothetical protein
MLLPLRAYAVDQYADDLAGMYGEIQQVKATEEICSRQFPSTAIANRQSVASWRQEYSSFVGDIETRWNRWLVAKANGDPRQHDALVVWSRQLYESTTDDLRQRFALGGLELFYKRCENYPTYLKSSRMNPELAHASTVQRIRRISQ